jgi:hypothetical protein
MNEVLEVASRALHILSVVMLLGSAFYIKFVEEGIERIPAWYVLLPTVAILATGFYQFWLTIQSGTVDKGWHITFGIKFLFVLHILAVSLLQLRNQADEQKRKRWMNSIVLSGLVVIVLSATLRLLHLR